MTDVFAHLNTLGYTGSFVAGNRLLPVSRFDPVIHQRRDGEKPAGRGIAVAGREAPFEQARV